ncbi:MAG TPA: hypothetical protein VIS49_00455 [Cyclobacteriaceae bacterium]
MAKATFEIISAIRATAKSLAASATYQWGHMGACNCGFLAQQVTSLTKKEIHTAAMEGHGDWREQLNDYCPTSGLKMDMLISHLLEFGFDIDDLTHLERLSDREVLAYLPSESRNLMHNRKDHVVIYLLAMAQRLADQLLAKIKLPDYDQLHPSSSRKGIPA